MPRPLAGFVAGFLSVLIFHQGALLILGLLGIYPGFPWPMTPVPPVGVPAVISLAFWGGLWGLLWSAIDHRFTTAVGGNYLLAGLIFGAVFPTLVFWFVVAPLKGMPLGGGFSWPGIVIGPIVNGAWGLGTALLLPRLAGRRLARA